MSDHPRRAIYSDILPARFPPQTSTTPAPATSRLPDHINKIIESRNTSQKVSSMDSEQNTTTPIKNPFVDTETDDNRKDSGIKIDEEELKIWARFARREDTPADREYVRKRIADASYDDGYDKGYAKGHEDGRVQACKQCYDKGRDDGYDLGRDNGFDECDRRRSAAQNRWKAEKDERARKKERNADASLRADVKKDWNMIRRLFRGKTTEKREKVGHSGYGFLDDGEAEGATKENDGSEKAEATKETVRPQRKDAWVSPYWFA